jgi:hypothetical protein
VKSFNEMKVDLEFWWFHHIRMPLWRLFASDNEREELRQSLKRRRLENPCSMMNRTMHLRKEFYEKRKN